MISGVVVTKNSEVELRDCLKSLDGFAQEIVVVDLESTDNTKKIAKEFGAKVYDHPSVKYVELVRQFAFEKATNDWIILLDPDERLSQGLKENLKNIGDEVSAVNIPRKNIFFGKWIRHTNFWPDRQIRFFKKSAVSWPKIIHSYPVVSGHISQLHAKPDLAIEHYGYNNFQEFFERQNRYSTVEAENLFNLGKRFNYFNLFWQPTREILARYFRHLGFLDGFTGISLVYALAVYKFSVQIKLWQREFAS